MIEYIEVITIQGVRLSGKTEPEGKLVGIPRTLLPIWIERGLCKLPETPNSIPPTKDGDVKNESENNISASGGAIDSDRGKKSPKSRRNR